jgi:8-oxo-dGTP pyrophosphatase MutT (NUDIX family)
MLRFACAAAHVLDSVRSAGLPVGTPLFDTLVEAQADCQARYAEESRLLVVDTTSLALNDPVGDAHPSATAMLAGSAPPDHLPNLEPYLLPREVVAAGGLVVRHSDGAPEVLLIHRRGVWDLPKGKQDKGESVAETALREVQEEVGIETLDLLGNAGTTVHGYAEKGRYCVKTTYWFRMATPQTDFVPEEREGIEAVAYVPWAEVRARLGYDTLQALLASLDPAAITT